MAKNYNVYGQELTDPTIAVREMHLNYDGKDKNTVIDVLLVDSQGRDAPIMLEGNNMPATTQIQAIEAWVQTEIDSQFKI